MKCQLCSHSEALAQFIILDSHLLENEPVKMYLCALCIKDLRDAGVRLKPIEGIEPKREKEVAVFRFKDSPFLP